MNIFNQLKTELEKIILLLADDFEVEINQKQLANFTVEPCKDKKHGDVATNIAMILCKNFGKKPQELAGEIIKKLGNNFYISKAEVAGAGFINITFENKIWYQFLMEVLNQLQFSLPQIGSGENINIEYASPNPTGPMHVGHTRGAIYGDVLANLLAKTGYNITREYYINDAGSQIITLVKSAYLRYLEALGENITIPEGLYPGEYLQVVGQQLKEEYSNSLKNKSEAEYIPLIRDFVVNKMMAIIVADLELLGIKHDWFFSEKKQLHDTGKIEEAIKILEKKGLIYKGIISAPKGTIAEDYDSKEQTLFRSTLFGDDMDRVVKKADGTPTYLAGDIAYSLSKFQRGATKMILPLGYDHAGYVKRLSAVVNAVTDGKAEVKVILCQMVKFIKNGEPFKMSKRSGNFITARDVVNEVGADVMRFTMLTRKNDAPFDFDLAKVLEQSKDNPIFYVQYAYARSCSVLRNLKQEMPDLYEKLYDKIDTNILKNLTDETEIELIKKLAAYPRVIEMAVINFEPHRIAFYLQELAAIFHSLWNKGSENHELKFIIVDNYNLTKARIHMIIAMQKIISSALSIFNIKPLEEMR
jgi:arginyl-tRNA synthetase